MVLAYSKEITIRGQNNGYDYFIDYEHPLATGNSGRVYFHRHIVSIKLGRWVTREEHVHHIDENKLNNLPTNLAVLSASEHCALHQGGFRPVFVCQVCASEFIAMKPDQKFCSTLCFNSHSIKNKSITKELLDDLIPKHTWISLGKLLGYSDSGIRKRAKALGCVIPSRRKSQS